MHLVLLALEPAEEAANAFVVASVALDDEPPLLVGVRSCQGTSSGMSSCVAPRASAPRAAPDSAACVHGSIAPCRIDLVGSGTTRSMSSSMMLPNPWQVGQAPKGLLNENSRGCGSSYAMPQRRHSNRSLNTWRPRTGHRRADLERRTPRRRLPVRRLDRVGQPRRGVAVDLHAIDDDRQHRAGRRRAARSSSSSATARPSTSRRPKPRFAQALERRADGIDGAGPLAPRRGSRRAERQPVVRCSRRLALVQVGQRESRLAPPRSGMSKPMSRRVPAGSAISRRATTSGVSRTTSRPHWRQIVRPDARPEQPHVVVDLGGGADRRSRVADAVLLPDGDGRAMPSIRSTSGFSIRSRNCRA